MKQYSSVTFNPNPSFNSYQRSPPRPPPNPSGSHSRSPIFINEPFSAAMDPLELKTQREFRFQALQEAIKGVYNQILEDELLNAMKEDSSSTEFLNQRVKEIFEEVIESDREIYIDKLMSQYSYMKTMYKQMEEEMRRLTKELSSTKETETRHSSSQNSEKREYQKTIESLEEENKRLQSKLASFTGNFNENMKKKDNDLQKSLEAKLEYENRIESLQKQLKEQLAVGRTMKGEIDSSKMKERELAKDLEMIKGKYSLLEEQNRKLLRNIEENSEKESSFRLKLEGIIEENKVLLSKIEGLKEEKFGLEKDFQEKIEKINEKNRENEQNFQEFMENSKVKTKQKIENYKAKILEYKEINLNFQSTIEDLEMVLQREKQHSMQKEEDIKEKIKEIEDFYQEKLKEEKMGFDMKIEKIKEEIQQDSEKRFSKIRGKKKNLKQQLALKVAEIDRSSFDRRTFEEMLSKKDKIIEDLTNKLIAYDREQDIKLKKTIEIVEAKKETEYEQKLKTFYRKISKKLE